MKILIPTCRPKDELAGLVRTISEHSGFCSIVVSGLQASASVNRNACLNSLLPGEIAVMLDDDIEGFYQGWMDDLTAPFRDPLVVMVSARLLNPDGSFGPTCSRCYDAEPEEIAIKSNGVCILPTAAIAFRYFGHRYDENFVGSGFEDSDYCFQILRDKPEAKFIQSNRCRLIHRNLMRNQKGAYWKHNALYFHNKWNGRKVEVNVA